MEFNEVISKFIGQPNPSERKKNAFMSALDAEATFIHTTNGAVAKSTTNSALYDLFALGAAYRSRNDDDCLLLFKKAFDENPDYAMKCLTYIRDIEGQGERRFFRVILAWLGAKYPDIVKKNIPIWIYSNMIRWDDLFVLFNTPVERYMTDFIGKQLLSDIKDYNASPTNSISLLAKWMPSINASSCATRERAENFCRLFKFTPREYRKLLAKLRERIKVVERLMSQNRWQEIEFDKLPSRAGLIYRNAFARNGLIAEKYKQFAQSDDTKVNASVLYPYDCVREVVKMCNGGIWDWGLPSTTDTNRLMVNKYWDNLKDVFSDGEKFDAMVVCDTSASMLHGASKTATPMEVAVSLAIYAAERAKGPFNGNYISFSRTARLVKVAGVDFCDKVARIISSNVCENTNLQNVFKLVLDTAIKHHVPVADMPKTLVVITDMQVDAGYSNDVFIEEMHKHWNATCRTNNCYYPFPKLVLWNVNAVKDTFLAGANNNVTYVSGCSPVILRQVMTGVAAEELMFQTLNAERYSKISA